MRWRRARPCTQGALHERASEGRCRRQAGRHHRQYRHRARAESAAGAFTNTLSRIPIRPPRSPVPRLGARGGASGSPGDSTGSAGIDFTGACTAGGAAAEVAAPAFRLASAPPALPVSAVRAPASVVLPSLARAERDSRAASATSPRPCVSLAEAAFFRAVHHRRHRRLCRAASIHELDFRHGPVRHALCLRCECAREKDDEREDHVSRCGSERAVRHLS